jgi:hypothetical protein
MRTPVQKKYLNFCALLTATAAFLSAPGLRAQLPDSQALSASFGMPIFSHEYKGVGFRVFAAEGLKIVAVNPPNTETPAFLSFTRENGTLSEAEINQFLANFSAKSGVPWKIFDRSVPDRAIQFFMSAPYANQSAASKMLSQIPDQKAAAAAWEKLVRDPRARQEASGFLDMLRAQKQIWVTADGKFLAAWSPDGASLGVGVLPPIVRK